MDSKDIYLKKDNQIIGLHAIGHKEPYEFELIDTDGSSKKITTDFMELQKWGNKYDQNLNMIGGSFHVFDYSIDKAAQEFEAVGWVRFSP